MQDRGDMGRVRIKSLSTLALVAVLVPWESAALLFSIDAASPSASLVSSSDVLAPGPVGGPPAVESASGFAGPPVDEVNAFSGLGLGPTGPLVLHFSVDRTSAGASSLRPGVLSESAFGQQAGDLYWTRLSGWNRLAFNQDSLGLLPPVTHGLATAPPIDDVDALTRSTPVLMNFTLAPGHPYTGGSGEVGCGADLFSSFVNDSYTSLGLASCDDDVDGLQIQIQTTPTVNELYYSLAPGSPSLLPGSPILGCALGCSAADIFVKRTGAQAEIFATASDLGLLSSDNVDALGFLPVPARIIPAEAPALGPFALGVLALLLVTAPALLRRRLRRPLVIADSGRLVFLLVHRGLAIGPRRLALDLAPGQAAGKVLAQTARQPIA